MSNYPPPGDGGPPPAGDDRPPPRRSRSPSPMDRRRRGRRGSRSRSPRSRSYSRSRSPPFRKRSRSPPRRRRGGSRGGSRGGRSPSWSRSRSRSPPRGGRFDRDRVGRGDGFRGRGPPPGPGYGPPDDFNARGGYGGGYDGPRGPPPHDMHHDPNGPGPRPHRGPPPPHMGGGGGRRRDEGPPGVSLLVRNVSPEVTTQELQQAFGRIGEVRDVYIPRDFHSQQPKGFAFIEYATPDMAREAREEMHRFRIKGSELEVVFAQERRKTPHEMRGRVVNQNNRPGDRRGDRGDRGSRENFERSSSFERHKQRRRDDEHRRDGPGFEGERNGRPRAGGPVKQEQGGDGGNGEDGK